jgi:hypothetical protein
MTTPRRGTAAAITILTILIAVLLPGLALAQSGSYTCRWVARTGGGFALECTPVGTATPRPTSTPRPTATATRVPPTSTPTATATNTPMPPPSATPTTLPPVQATGPLTVNVPLLLDASPGDDRLNANNRAIIWVGDISPAGGYSQARLIGRDEGLSVYVQAMTPLAGGAFALTVNGRTYPGTYGAADGWDYGGTGVGWRGWGASRLIPWAELGGAPQPGDAWALTLKSVGGGQWTGTLHWGLPDYSGREGTHTVTVPLLRDASLGGGTDCAHDDDPLRVPQLSPDWFRDWGGVSRGAWGEGTISLGAIPYASVQNQWYTTDWPCFAQYVSAWAMPQLPAGAQITGAWLDVNYFGHSWPGPTDPPFDDTRTVFQAFEVAPAFDEATVAWDTAPQAGENVSWTLLDTCAAGTDCFGWRSLDVTEIVRRAHAGGRTEAGVLFYTAAGSFHSGKYFDTREGGAPPVVRISYTVSGEPTWTPTAPPPAPPSATPTATSAPPATATPTIAPSATPTRAAPTATSTPSIPPPPVTGRAFYLSPAGNDSAAGTLSAPWRSFARAWQSLRPGDTLLLLDGTYTETMRPTISGEPGAPITVRAQNDGAVTIDAGGNDVVVALGDHHAGHGNWFVIEGIVGRNGSESVFKVVGDNNILRRVSAYDVNPDGNALVILLWGDNNLVEDAVAAGTGRYMYDVFQGSGNTLRRVFAMWKRWDGKRFCGVTWPNGNNIGVYNASNTTVENAIAYGRSLTGIFIQANHDEVIAENNYILGSMALLQGRDYNGSVWHYGSPTWPDVTRPGPTVNPSTPGANCDNAVTRWEWGNLRSGFSMWGQGTVRNNVFRDILATGNMGTGFNAAQPYTSGEKYNNVVDHATLWGNGADIPNWEAAWGGNISLRMDGVNEPTNSRIAGSKWAEQGEGARLQYRYVNRQLTDQPLLPWPMEGRIQAELGISVNAIVVAALDQAAGGRTPFPVPGR